MSISFGHRLHIQPRAALLIASRLRQCHPTRAGTSATNREIERVEVRILKPLDRALGSASSRCRRFSTQASAFERRGRTSWDRAADVYFSEVEAGRDTGRRLKDFGRDDREAASRIEDDYWRDGPGPSGRQARRDDAVDERSGRGGRSRATPFRRDEEGRFKNTGRNQLERAEPEEDGGRFDAPSRRSSLSTEARSGKPSPWELATTGSGVFSPISRTSSRKPLSFRDRPSSRNPRRERRPEDSGPRPSAKEQNARPGRDRVTSEEVGSFGRGYGRAARPMGENRWTDGAGRAEERRERYSEWGGRNSEGREASSLPEIEGQALYGVAPIVSALQACRRTFYTLYMQENLAQNVMTGKRKDKSAIGWIERKAKSLGLAVKETSKHNLNIIVDNRPHQGLVLDASPLELVPIDSLETPENAGRAPVWLALDEITDPQNFGAVLRSAYFLGADGVVVCSKNSAPLSGVVSKASAGALEIMDVQCCRSMIKFLEKSRERGWRVLGGASAPGSVPLREVPRGVATILVLGNEGRGMRTMVKRSCDQLISIPGSGTISRVKEDLLYDKDSDDDDDDEELVEEEEFTDPDVQTGAEVGLGLGPMAVDSLNVSVAAGIFLHELLTP